MTEEDKKTLEDILKHAREEISLLRRENELLQAQISMVKLFEKVLLTQPHYHSQGMSEDVNWKIDTFLDVFNAKYPKGVPTAPAWSNTKKKPYTPEEKLETALEVELNGQ